MFHLYRNEERTDIARKTKKAIIGWVESFNRTHAEDRWTARDDAGRIVFPEGELTQCKSCGEYLQEAGDDCGNCERGNQ